MKTELELYEILYLINPNFTEQELEVKPKIKKKSFFDKFTDGLKEFLDNAE